MSKAPYGTCGNCRFYHEEISNCRRNAPSGHLDPGRIASSSFGRNWAVVSSDDWCGEWMSLTDIQLSSTYGESVTFGQSTENTEDTTGMSVIYAVGSRGDSVVQDSNVRVIIAEPYTEVPMGSSVKFICSGGNGEASGRSGGGGCTPRFKNVGITFLAEPTEPTAD